MVVIVYLFPRILTERVCIGINIKHFHLSVRTSCTFHGHRTRRHTSCGYTSALNLYRIAVSSHGNLRMPADPILTIATVSTSGVTHSGASCVLLHVLGLIYVIRGINLNRQVRHLGRASFIAEVLAAIRAGPVFNRAGRHTGCVNLRVVLLVLVSDGGNQTVTGLLPSFKSVIVSDLACAILVTIMLSANRTSPIFLVTGCNTSCSLCYGVRCIFLTRGKRLTAAVVAEVIVVSISARQLSNCRATAQRLATTQALSACSSTGALTRSRNFCNGFGSTGVVIRVLCTVYGNGITDLCTVITLHVVDSIVFTGALGFHRGRSFSVITMRQLVNRLGLSTATSRTSVGLYTFLGAIGRLGLGATVPAVVAGCRNLTAILALGFLPSLKVGNLSRASLVTKELTAVFSFALIVIIPTVSTAGRSLAFNERAGVACRNDQVRLISHRLRAILVKKYTVAAKLIIIT